MHLPRRPAELHLHTPEVRQGLLRSNPQFAAAELGRLKLQRSGRSYRQTTPSPEWPPAPREDSQVLSRSRHSSQPVRSLVPPHLGAVERRLEKPNANGRDGTGQRSVRSPCASDRK